MTKRHEASPRKIARARREGDLPAFGNAVSLVAAAAGLFVLGRLSDGLVATGGALVAAGLSPGAPEPGVLLGWWAARGAAVVAGVFGTTCAVGAGLGAFRTKGGLFTSSLVPKAGRHVGGAWISGMKPTTAGIVSGVLRTLGAVAVVAAAAAAPGAFDGEGAAGGLRAVWTTGLVVLVTAAAAESVLRYRAWRVNLRMTADEVKREHREENGDPYVKAYRSALHEAVSRQDLTDRVRRARVVVVERTGRDGAG